MRSCYTAMAVATALCLDTRALAAKAGMADYIRRCQVRCLVIGAACASVADTSSFHVVSAHAATAAAAAQTWGHHKQT